MAVPFIFDFPSYKSTANAWRAWFFFRQRHIRPLIKLLKKSSKSERKEETIFSDDAAKNVSGLVHEIVK